MIATVSPAADNYEETLSTLRYADRAKRIVNHAVVNEDPNARIIRELREEVEKLRVQLSQAEVSEERKRGKEGFKSGFQCYLICACFSHQSLKAPELKEKLHESEKLIQEMTVTWEEKLRKTEEIATVRTTFCFTRRLWQPRSHRPPPSLPLPPTSHCPLTGASETAGEHGHLPGDVGDQSEGRQVFPGQPERRPRPERAAGLLPEGSPRLTASLVFV